METLDLTCGHCGAPLSAPSGTRFVTCGYCSARLEIHRSGEAIYTEVLEAIEAKTDQIAENLETIKIQNELERLDREWLQEREGYMIRGKHGATMLPSRTLGTMMTVFAVAFGLFWTMLAGAMFPPMAIFGVIFIAIAVVSGVRGLHKAGQYERGQQAYEERRRELLESLAAREAEPLGGVGDD
jgi:hypothetical protein